MIFLKKIIFLHLLGLAAPRKTKLVNCNVSFELVPTKLSQAS